MNIKEYVVKQDWSKRPLLEVKTEHEVQKLHDISGTYNNPEIISDMLFNIFDVSHLAEEYVWMLTLDSAHKITGLFELSHGSVNRSIMNSREIIQRALLAGAVNIVIAHCHPSGEPNPSDMDVTVTKRLSDSCRLCGIPLLDHIILGCNEDKNYYSFIENGLLKN